MIENEIKILDINHHVVMAQLELLGAERSEITCIQDRYYDTAERSLEKNKQRMRIREQDGQIVITKKTILPTKANIKSMKEEDLTMKNVHEAHDMLGEFGLQCIRQKKKKRISYYIDDMVFDFDFYKNLPPVLEIEGEDIKKIFYRIRRLWLHYHTQVKRGSRKLFKHYTTKK